MARTLIHPGEHLAEELKDLRMSATVLARQIDVPVNRVTDNQFAHPAAEPKMMQLGESASSQIGG